MSTLNIKTLKADAIANHIKLIKELELEYMNHINKLLNQKTIIHSQLQQSFYLELNKIDQLKTKKKKQKNRFKTCVKKIKQKNKIPKLPIFDPTNLSFIPIANNTAIDQILNKNQKHKPKLPSISSLSASSTASSPLSSSSFLCICGEYLRKMQSTTRAYGTVFCDICNQKLKKNQIFYHCDKERDAKQHQEGFDICSHCANQQKEADNMQVNTNINANVNTNTTANTHKKRKKSKHKHKHKQKCNTNRMPIINMNDIPPIPIIKNLKTDPDPDIIDITGTHSVIKKRILNPNTEFETKQQRVRAALPVQSSACGLSLTRNNWKCYFNECSYVTSNKNEMNSHILSVHSSRTRPYICQFCDKRFFDNKHLLIHVRSHSFQQRFSCIYCPFSTSKKLELNCHMQYHSGNKPVVCNICNKQYMTHKSLMIHQKNYHSRSTNTSIKRFK